MKMTLYSWANNVINWFPFKEEEEFTYLTNTGEICMVQQHVQSKKKNSKECNALLTLCWSGHSKHKTLVFWKNIFKTNKPNFKS